MSKINSAAHSQNENHRKNEAFVKRTTKQIYLPPHSSADERACSESLGTLIRAVSDFKVARHPQTLPDDKKTALSLVPYKQRKTSKRNSGMETRKWLHSLQRRDSSPSFFYLPNNSGTFYSPRYDKIWQRL